MNYRSFRSFRYLADPVCLASMLIYLVNRLLLKPWGISGEFGQCYLNDVLCLPMLLPMILYVQRLVGLRRHDMFPRMWEVLQHWAVFSVVFEVVVPAQRGWFLSVADPYDVIAYLVGGWTARLFWSQCGSVVVSDGRSYDSVVEPVSAG